MNPTDPALLGQFRTSSHPLTGVVKPEHGYYMREPIYDGRILAYRFVNTSRAAADAWYPDIAEQIMTWPDDQPLMFLIDLRGQETMLSAQAMTRARQVSRLRPELPGRTAVIIGGGTVVQILSSIIRSGLANTRRERALFSSEEAAVDWLLRIDPRASQIIRRVRVEDEGAV